MITKKYMKIENSDTVKVVVKTRSTSFKLSHYLSLFEEAKKDFPHLTIKDIDAVEYAGNKYRGQRGIEFNMLLTEIPQTYQEILQKDFRDYDYK